MGTKTQIKYAAAAGEARGSTQLADVLRAKWKNQIKPLSPSKRWAWLKSSEVIVGLGAKTAANLVKQLERRDGEAPGAFCSPGWVEAWLYEGRLPPLLRFEADDEIVQVDDGRRHSVKLVRSVGCVRAGDSGGAVGHLPTAGVGTSRWTPPVAVAWEDENDLMTVGEAYYFTYPSSCSAEAIRRIGMLKGREDKRQRGKSKKRAGAEVQEAVVAMNVSDRVVELSQGGGVYRGTGPVVGERASVSDAADAAAGVAGAELGDRNIRVQSRDVGREG